MGFLGSIGNFFSGAVKTVAKTITSPAKLTTAVVTGGASLVAPNTFKPLTQAVGNTLYNPSLLAPVLSKAALPTLPTFPTIGASPMGLNLGNLLPGLVSGLGTLVGGGSPSAALSSFTNFLPNVTSNPYAQPAAMRLPGSAAAGAVVGRSFFNRFPNLAAVIQAWRNRGVNLTRSKLYSLLKRFGPEILVSGGIITAAAVSELMVAGPGRRHMNAGNATALRRSLRRLESFHRLCARVDKLRSPRSRVRSRLGAASRSTTLIRQG